MSLRDINYKMYDIALLVAGSRKWTDRAAVEAMMVETVNSFEIVFPNVVVITGDAPGADTIAHQIAVEREYDSIVHIAEWQKYGKLAGPIRNSRMLKDLYNIGWEEHPCHKIVLGFPMQDSRGTIDTIRKAMLFGFEVVMEEESWDIFERKAGSINA